MLPALSLQTERLCLREFRPEDGPAIYEIQRHPAYVRFYPWEQVRPQDSQQWVDEFVSWQQQTPRVKYQFAFSEIGSERIIGNCGVRIDDLKHRQGNMGYEVHPDYWGRGYASEAAAAMVRFAFSTLHLHRLWALCVSENIASWKVLEKMHMRREGHFRERVYFKGQWHDHYHYGLLASEWRAQQADLATSPDLEGLWSNIPTVQMGALRSYLSRTGWTLISEYQGIDAGIDYSESRFAKQGLTLNLQWDPWEEGRLSGPIMLIKALQQALNH
jgi:RimJ/RimL family protein N-acetyltransferase